MIDFSWALRLAVALVFAAAVVGKIRAGRAAMAELVEAIEKLNAPVWLSGPIAGAVVTGEVGAVVLTAWPATAVAGCALALTLSALFTAAVARLVATRSGMRCRCFGKAENLGRHHATRNATLAAGAAVALVSTIVVGRGAPAPVDLPLVFVAAAAGAGFIVFWDDLAALMRPIRS
jgi:hypothetical protein